MNLGKMISEFFARKQYSSTSFDTTNDEMMGKLVMRMGGGPSKSGQPVNETTAMRIATAWCCMRVIAETIGAVPWAVYRKDASGNAEKDETHWLTGLIDSPNGWMTEVDFKEHSALSLCQNGNAYSYKETSGSTVISVDPFPAHCITPMRKRGANTSLSIPEGAVFYRYSERGKTEDLPREKVWHVRGFGGTGIAGLSPIGAAKEAMGLSLSAEEFGSRFFSQGGMPSGIVTIPNFFTAEQRAVARENLAQMMGGLGTAHKFVLFEGGMKPEAWKSMNLDDMQFIETRKFSIAEICRFYRVPPHMVADLERATFSNIEHLSQEFVMYTLMPYFTRIEASVNKWLLPPEDRGKVFLRFNFEALLRADSAGRAQFYSQALQNGWMNRNEVRAKENLNKVEGLDEYTAQTNLTPVEKLGEIIAQRAFGRGAPPAAAPAAPKEAPVIMQSQHPDLTEFERTLRDIKIRLQDAEKNILDTARYATEHPGVKKLETTLFDLDGEISHRLKEIEQAALRAAEEAAFKAAAGAINKHSHELFEQVEALRKAHAESLKSIERAARMPRKAVYDPKTGEVLGAVPVEKLE